MPKIFTPDNQVRITDVSIVRIKKGGKRFEIACYKNRVVAWRNKTETDLDEVLQTPTVFTNVSKGQFAKTEDLIELFGTDDQTEICKEILVKGELQITDKERAAQLEALFKETANIISDKCVNPETNRPYTISMIETAMKQAHIPLKLTRNAKQHALEAIPKLKDVLPIERAQMRIKVTSSSNEAKKFKEKLITFAKHVEHESWNKSELCMILLIDPGCYRKIEDLIYKTKSGGVIQVLSLKEVAEADVLMSV